MELSWVGVHGSQVGSPQHRAGLRRWWGDCRRPGSERRICQGQGDRQEAQTEGLVDFRRVGALGGPIREEGAPQAGCGLKAKLWRVTEAPSRAVTGSTQEVLPRPCHRGCLARSRAWGDWAEGRLEATRRWPGCTEAAGEPSRAQGPRAAGWLPEHRETHTLGIPAAVFQGREGRPWEPETWLLRVGAGWAAARGLLWVWVPRNSHAQLLRVHWGARAQDASRRGHTTSSVTGMGFSWGPPGTPAAAPSSSPLGFFRASAGGRGGGLVGGCWMAPPAGGLSFGLDSIGIHCSPWTAASR